MKLAIIVVAMILLSCFEPTTQAQKRRGRVLRMCEKRFSTCLSNSRFRRDYKAGPKCCGRAWTVSLTNEFNRLNPWHINIHIIWKTKTNKAANETDFIFGVNKFDKSRALNNRFIPIRSNSCLVPRSLSSWKFARKGRREGENWLRL